MPPFLNDFIISFMYNIFSALLLVWSEFKYVFIVLHLMNLRFEVLIQSLLLVYL